MSNQFINITTPENKTYISPMNGYFLASYGFENDLSGMDPMEWSVDQGGGTIEVISEKGGHKKIVEFHDTSGFDDIAMGNDFTSQSIGTIELWVRITDATDSIVIEIKDTDGGDRAFATRLRNDIIVTEDPGWQTIVDPALDNTWYHIRWDFDCSSDTYDIYIDGNLKRANCDFSTSLTSIGHILIRTSNSPNNYYCYLDAIGYSWDPNYNIGDNLNEGLLLDFETSDVLDWIAYSLDRQSNITILGDTTISMPYLGTHSIQVFGNETLGPMHQSDIRYFTIVYFINITTPENKTYLGPTNGSYLATFGFENDIDGNVPFGWSDRSHAGCGVEVISELGGHKKVLECWDKSNSGYSSVYNYFSPKIYGTIEWWWRQSRSGVASHVSIGSGPTLRWSINSNLQYDDLNGNSHTVKSVQPNRWYHFKVIFNCYSDTFDLYINQVLEVDDAEFRYEKKTLSYFKSYTWYTHSQYSSYIDALGYSWDPNYNIGDNFKEGLLLSFESNIDFDWTGYSLDGQENKTILGNTTIPMPDNGTHSIQVFGNDSLGNKNGSEIRFFTISAPLSDYEAPTGGIYSPVSNELFGEAPPSFNVTITDNIGVNTMWYNLNGGSNIIFIANGTIDSTEWANMPNGTVTITFYANDSAGNVAAASVTVRKDIEGLGEFNPVIILMAILGIISFLIIIGVIMTLMRSRKKQVVIIKEPPKIFPQEVDWILLNKCR